MKFYIIYKTTNILNRKYYIGKHSTSNLNDGYLGSGKILGYSINLHGRQNFKIEILEFCNNKKSLALREKEIVNENILKDPLCMNLVVGGDGGWYNDTAKSLKANNKKLWLLKNDINWANQYRSKLRDKRSSVSNISFLNKKHTETTKRKIGLTNSIKQSGNRNSQFGKCWIYSLAEKKNLSIPKENIENWLSKGWIKGRKIGL